MGLGPVRKRQLHGSMDASFGIQPGWKSLTWEKNGKKEAIKNNEDQQYPMYKYHRLSKSYSEAASEALPPLLHHHRQIRLFVVVKSSNTMIKVIVLAVMIGRKVSVRVI